MTPNNFLISLVTSIFAGLISAVIFTYIKYFCWFDDDKVHQEFRKKFDLCMKELLETSTHIN